MLIMRMLGTLASAAAIAAVGCGKPLPETGTTPVAPTTKKQSSIPEYIPKYKQTEQIESMTREQADHYWWAVRSAEVAGAAREMQKQNPEFNAQKEIDYIFIEGVDWDPKTGAATPHYTYEDLSPFQKAWLNLKVQRRDPKAIAIILGFRKAE